MGFLSLFFFSSRTKLMQLHFHLSVCESLPPSTSQIQLFEQS